METKALWRDRQMVLWAWVVFALIFMVVGRAFEKHFELGDWWFPTWLIASMCVHYLMGRRIMHLHFDAPSAELTAASNSASASERAAHVC